jgi:hypothetical protein
MRPNVALRIGPAFTISRIVSDGAADIDTCHAARPCQAAKCALDDAHMPDGFASFEQEKVKTELTLCNHQKKEHPFEFVCRREVADAAAPVCEPTKSP